MIGIFRTDSGTGQKLSWLGTPAIRPIAPDLRIYDVNSETLSVERIALGPHSPIIQAPVTWFGCSFPDVERTGILVAFHTVQPSGTPISHYTKFGELSPDGLFYGNTYTTLYSEEPQDHVPVGIIKLASGALVAAFYSLTLDGNKVQYSFHYRTTPQTGSVWKTPVSVSLPFVASTDTNQSCALIQHWDRTIYFFRHLTSDSSIGSINLIENLSLGTISVNTDPTKVPNSDFISTAHTLPPFVTSPQLRVTLDVYRQGIILAYQTSVDAASNNRARMAFCFVASDATKTFVQMTGKYVLNSGAFEIGSKTDVPTVWFAGECLDDAGAATPVQVGVYSASTWSFTNTVTIQNPIYPVRDDFGSAFGSGTVSGFGYLVSGNIYFKVFADYQPSLPPGTLAWLRTMVSPLNEGVNVLGKGVGINSDGDAVVAGTWSNNVGRSVDFGDGGVSSISGTQDGFVVKYSSGNVFRWFRQLGAIREQQALGVIVDSQNSAIVVGTFQDSVDFGGITLTATPTGYPNVFTYDIFVAKYSSSNILLWAKNFGGVYSDFGRAVAVDSNNNVIIAASFISSADFGGTILSGSTSASVAIAKLNRDTGDTIWAKESGMGGGNNFPRSVAVDNNGDVIVCGDYVGTSNFGGGNRPNADTNGVYSDIFIVKRLGTDGSYVWDKTMGNTKGDVAYGVCVDPTTNNIVICGTFYSQVDFGGGVRSDGNSGVTLFMAGYGTGGNYLWDYVRGGSQTLLSGIDKASAVKIKSGKLVLTGQAESPIRFPEYPLGTTIYGVGYFVACYSISGDSVPINQWAHYSATAGGGLGAGIGFDNSGNVFIAGDFQNTTDFGGTTATVPPLASGGFLAKYKT